MGEGNWINYVDYTSEIRWVRRMKVGEGNWVI